MRHKHADLIHAWAEGAEIEVKTPSGWKDVPDPSWIPTIKYRINPRTVRREGWVNIFRSPIGISIVAAPIFELKEDAEDSKPTGWITTTRIEWEEEI
jgi:hypothetical protein